MAEDRLRRVDYEILGQFRCDFRRFASRSETEARRLGVPPQQHQALLVVAGCEGPGAISVGDLAECLSLKVHTVTELVARMVEAGLLSRSEFPEDRRRSMLALTHGAGELLARLSDPHRNELDAIGPFARRALQRLRSRGSY